MARAEVMRARLSNRDARRGQKAVEAVVGNILRDMGGGFETEPETTEALYIACEDYLLLLLRKADRFAKADGRVSVQARDFQRAVSSVAENDSAEAPQ
ncbi:hypothetical protein SLS57_006220 [Botryosphaeria dothidea]